VRVVLEDSDTRDGDPGIRLDWDGTGIRVDCLTLRTHVPPLPRTLHVDRDGRHHVPLITALRTALASRLPFERALPIHGAGIVIDGKAVVCFGPSGAGKSTLARCLPFTALSDELVVVRLDPPRAQAAGIWSERQDDRCDPATYPLAALVEIAKGLSPRLEALPRETVTRKLMTSLLLPVAPPLWTAAIPLVQELSRTVPGYRLTWSLADDPSDALRELTQTS
jgi:hypothetical protein